MVFVTPNVVSAPGEKRKRNNSKISPSVVKFRNKNGFKGTDQIGEMEMKIDSSIGH